MLESLAVFFLRIGGIERSDRLIVMEISKMKEIAEYIVVNLLTSGGLLTLVYFIVREKIKAHIQFSIKLQYDKLLEDYKTSQIQRQKAALVAEWIAFPEDRKRLNQLTLEAFMWLPKDTSAKLSQMLTLVPGSPNVREIVEEVREIIIGKDEKIDPNSIILFPSKDKSK